MPSVLKVAIIGGGPGAMFVCHAWNQQKRKAREEGRELPNELQFTCFERYSRPGGIWREIPENSTEDLAAYEELWTNGPSHTLEFPDYTFDEHFDGTPVPVYLPRKDVTEYLMQRVTKDAPTFFEDYFQFHTEVVRVGELNDKDVEGNFQVTVRNLATGAVSDHIFDKCIWAAGENSQGHIPKMLHSLFSKITAKNKIEKEDEKKQSDNEQSTAYDAGASETDFKPSMTLLHSSETRRIREHIRNRANSRILLIGGGLSAEDLALQSLKWGAGHVYVAARDEDCETSWTTQWPGNRVTVHLEHGVRSANIDPEDGSTALIQLEEVEHTWPHGYKPYDDNDEDDLITLRKIDLVVCCTGYEANLSMLDDSLVPVGGRLAPYWGSLDHPATRLDNDSNFKWDEWTMTKYQSDYRFTGHVPVAQGRMVRANYNPPDMHRGILFRNPNMMFLCEHGQDIPLLSLDVHAWLLAAYLSGWAAMPSVPEMQEANRQQVLDQLHIPEVRYLVDEEYHRVVSETVKESDDGGYSIYMLRLLARIMEEGKHLGKPLGTYEKLSEHGYAIYRFLCSSYYGREDLKDNIPEDEDVQEAIQWRTFRDDVAEVEDIYSLYTGTKATFLKKRWMDLVGPTHSVKNGIV